MIAAVLLLFNVTETPNGKTLEAFNVIYGFLVPVGSFGLLGLLCFNKKIRINSLAGAAVGVFIGNVLPYALLFHSVITYEGGGAAIVVYLLVMATPILVAIFGVFGYFVGKSIGPRA